jgi:hypothetical protein
VRVIAQLAGQTACQFAAAELDRRVLRVKTTLMKDLKGLKTFIVTKATVAVAACALLACFESDACSVSMALNVVCKSNAVECSMSIPEAATGLRAEVTRL